jgi:AcrR family transcriptional regulator
MAGTRVADIAEQAGVNKQLLYYYFGSKAGLFGAAQSSMVVVARKLIAGNASGTYRERMLAAISPAAIERRRTLRRLWIWEALERGDQQIIREDERREAWQSAVGVVRQAQENGEVDSSFDPAMVTLAVDAIMNSPWIMPQVTQLITGMNPDTPEFRERLRKFLGQVLTALEPSP